MTKKTGFRRETAGVLLYRWHTSDKNSDIVTHLHHFFCIGERTLYLSWLTDKTQDPTSIVQPAAQEPRWHSTYKSEGVRVVAGAEPAGTFFALENPPTWAFENFQC